MDGEESGRVHAGVPTAVASDVDESGEVVAGVYAGMVKTKIWVCLAVQLRATLGLYAYNNNEVIEWLQ